MFKKHRKSFPLLLIIIASSCTAQKINVKKPFKEAEQQTRYMRSVIDTLKRSPELVAPRTIEKGELKLVRNRDWTSGFFAGNLWFLYEYTGNSAWAEQARKFTVPLESVKLHGGTHDLGFMVYNSFGNGYRLTGDEHYKAVILQAAKTLSTRFSKTTGTIKSWDGRKEWGYPTIIDNMMNLELLFEATKLSGDSSFYTIAVSHANTTMRNHFRNDNSSYHVVDYDTLIAGKTIRKTTHQGFADESAWSRGQAWGLYGFTLCYRETKNAAYLQQAEKIAAYILDHPNLPKDLIPYWDHNAPNIPNEPRDVSAAAITASALYELSMYSNNKKEYIKKADAIIKNITSAYRSPIGENKGFILLHSTGSKPHNSEVDVPLIYADYYYLEALLRSKKLKERKTIF